MAARPVRAPALYETIVRHVRSAPVRHDFAHRSAWWLVDVDDLPRGFEARDHSGDPALSLRQNVDAFLVANGIDLAGGQIVLLCSPRAAGHAFNPLSLYWCHDRVGDLVCVIAEVHNTYGDRHRYLLRTDSRGAATVEKALYVSPFHDVSGTYRLSVPVPDDQVRVSVVLHREGEPAFVASVHGRRVPLTRLSRARAALAGSGLRTAALIRRHGIALWFKGIPVQPRPTRGGR